MKFITVVSALATFLGLVATGPLPMALPRTLSERSPAGSNKKPITWEKDSKPPAQPIMHKYWSDTAYRAAQNTNSLDPAKSIVRGPQPGRFGTSRGGAHVVVQTEQHRELQAHWDGSVTQQSPQGHITHLYPQQTANNNYRGSSSRSGSR